MKGCPNGHWYDDADYANCPYCSNTAVPPNAQRTAYEPDKTMPLMAQNGADDIGKTMPLMTQSNADDIGRTMPLMTPQGNADDIGRTMPLMTPQGNADDIGKTMPLHSPAPDTGKAQMLIHEPFDEESFVGWLVCAEGANKGEDFRIHTEVNHIGRNENMDIRITGDNKILSENHASVTYDTRDKVFYLAPGIGRVIIRLGGKPVLTAVTLSPYDEIEMGESKFIFVPLCGSGFEWGN
jgi:hypothetical protein